MVVVIVIVIVKVKVITQPKPEAGDHDRKVMKYNCSACIKAEKRYGKLVLKLLLFNEVIFQDETSTPYRMLGLKN